ncbi:MAG: lysylphosphatidylglycerol synthase domain-containing protein, partial [Marinilabiliales bacterium]|nr:lysylphosphatidylglycerol synthase domain-containing protein [Marinilabiliales bacterium]
MNRFTGFWQSLSERASRFYQARSLSLTFIGENGKLILQAIFTLFSIAIGIWFFNHQKTELTEINHLLVDADWRMVLLGLSLTAAYVVTQGWMYVASFSTFGHKLPLLLGIQLFLKRNFISVFLPAGGVSSLAFFTSDIESRGVNKVHIHFASTIYGFVGILSVVLVAIPIFAYALSDGSVGSGEWVGLASVFLLLAMLYSLYRSFLQKGALYRFTIRHFPSLEEVMTELEDAKPDA